MFAILSTFIHLMRGYVGESNWRNVKGKVALMRSAIRQLWSIVGYAITLLLILLFTHGMGRVFQDEIELVNYSYYRLSLSVGFVGTLLVLGLKNIFSPRMLTRTFIICSTVLSFAGIVLLLLHNAALFRSALTYPSSFLIGVGLASMFALWQQTLANQDIDIVKNSIVGGTAIAALAGAPFNFVVDPGILFVVASICTLANGLLLYRFQSLEEEPSLKPSPNIGYEWKSQFERLMLSTWRYIVCVGTIGFASRVSQVLIENDSAPNLYITAATLLAAIVLGMVWRRNYSFRKVYGILTILVTACFLPITILGERFYAPIAGFTFFAFSLVSMFMVLTTVQISRARGMNPTAVFGIFTGCVYLITDIGPILIHLLGQGFGFSQVIIASLSTVYLLSIGGYVIGSLRSEHGETQKDSEEQQHPIVAQPEDRSSSFVQTVVIQRDLIPVCCEQLKRTYRLTTRETEVLELFARGRDLPRIAETLYVSQNTIRTHSRNLYRKLGVSSKQDALDMLEQCKRQILEEN